MLPFGFVVWIVIGEDAVFVDYCGTEGSPTPLLFQARPVTWNFVVERFGVYIYIDNNESRKMVW
jgi:hypothetical protein